MNIRSFALAALFLLLGGMTFSTKGQTEIIGDQLPPALSKYVSQLEGTEVSPGTSDEISNTIYGWNLSGQTSGDLTGYMFLSMNYSMSAARQPYARDLRTANTNFNLVSGGSWCKAIYVDGAYAGTVSGTILGGTVTWNEDYTSATLDLQLSGDNGTRNYAGAVGSGTFTGVVDRSTSTPTVSGRLYLAY